MPSKSTSQQILFGQAYAVRKWLDGDKETGLNPNNLNPEYKDDILKLANSMSKKDLSDYAHTKTKNLPYKMKENATMATPLSTNGMGAVSMPGPEGSGVLGSGDLPNPKRKKKKNLFKKFLEIKESYKAIDMYDNMSNESSKSIKLTYGSGQGSSLSWHNNSNTFTIDASDINYSGTGDIEIKNPKSSKTVLFSKPKAVLSKGIDSELTYWLLSGGQVNGKEILLKIFNE